MSRRDDLRNLLSPGRIGSLELRNRIVMTPMGSNLAEADGRAGEQIQAYYEARARGGAGLVIVGVAAIAHPIGTCNPNQLAVSDDTFLEGLQQLTERVHRHGAKIALQLQHAGKVATRDIVAGRPMWVPSMTRYVPGDLLNDLTPDERDAVTGAFRQPGARMSFHEMTHDDIGVLVGWFADAAARARRAGFDGVELHAGHGYLLSEFLSPHTNHRTDEYGGDVEGRSRLLVEVIRAVRERAGAEYPIWCRLDSKEFRTPGGITVDDAQRTAELAVEAGLDAIHVSAYADPTSGVAFTDAPLVHAPCGFVELAAGIKKRIAVPVIAVGRIEPEEGDSIIASGKADFIAMGRKLLADPDLPRKLAEGRSHDIRPCIYCYHCVGEIFLNGPIRCAVNPETGRETELTLRKAERPKRVLVVGGGPAGLEAARLAALRGHRVTLCERSPALGGTTLLSSLVYPPNRRLVDWLEAQVRALPVEIHLERNLELEDIRQLDPEVVLVAVGATRDAPAIPGASRRHVLGGEDLRALLRGEGGDGAARDKLSLVGRGLLGIGRLLGVSRKPELARELSRAWMPVGARIVLLGGGLVGVELAEFFAERGREVCVLEEGETLGAELAPPRRWRILHELREHGVELVTSARVEEITDDAVYYRGPSGGRERVACDTVIVASGTRESLGLAHAIADLDVEVHAIGDCSSVGYIAGAMMDAARVARAI